MNKLLIIFLILFLQTTEIYTIFDVDNSNHKGKIYIGNEKITINTTDSKKYLKIKSVESMTGYKNYYCTDSITLRVMDDKSKIYLFRLNSRVIYQIK